MLKVNLFNQPLHYSFRWLSQAEHRRRKWGVKGTSNSVPVAPMHPRISVIACISSLGEVFISLT